MTDYAAQYATGLTGPARGGEVVTPDDANDLPNIGRSSMVIAAGTVKVTSYDGSVINFPDLPAGFVIPMIIRRVWATDTSATILTMW